MSRPIEDYAMVGDTHTAALVAKDGSIDWLCLPRFDSPACFASLLGTEKNGFWRIHPAGYVGRVTREYQENTLILDTRFETDEGTAVLTDFMPVCDDETYHKVIRILRVERGTMKFNLDLRLRFEYGAIVPWVQHSDRGLTALAGANAVLVESPVPLHGEDFTSKAEFRLAQGESMAFSLHWFPSHREPPERKDPIQMLEQTHAWWTEWAERSDSGGLPHGEAVTRSLITLKGLTYSPTGAMVAAPTTSLPERIGGWRNWDYRYCWLRDASFVLDAFAEAGYISEVVDWQHWLLRAVAGHPSQVSVMYGVTGERRLTELELPLPGYEGSTPVRIGNAAYKQFQLDVFGDVMQSLCAARGREMGMDDVAWHLVTVFMEYLEGHWRDPDEGIWEVRGGPRLFTHSRVMAWVAAERASRLAAHAKDFTRAHRWRRLAKTIHKDVCDNGYDPKRDAFVQSYGSNELDASLLLIPAVGFLPADDPRMAGTIRSIERELMEDGFVRRYNEDSGVDGVHDADSPFLACSFWLADCYAMLGDMEKARGMFQNLLALRNDVGLLAEEYDPKCKRQVGNFPQALSHVALINTAWRCFGHNGGPPTMPPDGASEDDDE